MRTAAEEIKGKIEKLDVVINNAGGTFHFDADGFVCEGVQMLIGMFV